MSKPLLLIENLQVQVENKVVLRKLDLRLERGEVVALLGVNGSGKTSMVMSLLGDERYLIDGSSKIEFDGKDLLTMTVDERAKAGLYVGWQNPIVIPGLSVFSLCKASYIAQGNKIDELVKFKKKLEDLAIRVGLGKEYVVRNVNEGFSGGEKKRLELLQLLLLSPKLAILDEIDSGLDGEGIKILTEIIETLKKKGTSFVLITHNKYLLEEGVVDKIWEMKHGRLSARV